MMAQPTAYTPQHDYSNELGTTHGTHLDEDFDDIEQTTREIRVALSLIQADDGRLRNESVHPEAFSAVSLALMAGSWVPRGAWVTSTQYAQSDVVGFNNDAYVCVSDHTSGDFATDYANDLWLKIVANATVAAASVTLVSSGFLASTNVQDGLEEVSDEINNHLNDTADAHDASAISYAGATGISATDVEGALDELATEKANLAGANFTGAITAVAVNYAIAAGTADAIEATIAGITALTDGLTVVIQSQAANTSAAPTFNLNGLGATVIYKADGVSLAPGSIPAANYPMILTYSDALSAWTLANAADNLNVTVLDKTVTSQTIASSTVETALYSVTIPANTLGTRKSIKFKMIGDYLNSSGGASNLVVRVTFGATTVLTTGTVSIATGANRRALVIEGEISAANATNAQVGYAEISLGDSNMAATSQVESASYPPGRRVGGNNAIAEDTTASKNLQILITHGTSNANIQARRLMGQVILVP
jgi:hypothetical protein